MNIFSFLGDLSHLVSVFILIANIEQRHTIKGISLKTQLLYVLVFITRYLNLLTNYYSLYNSLMKIFFIGSSIYVVYLMTKKYHKSITDDYDNFPLRYLLGFAFIMSLVFTYSYAFKEVMWSFSLWLEAVAIIPQFYILQKTGGAEVLTSHYIFALGLYRLLYVPNWIYRYFTEDRLEYISVLAGILQTAVYSDFFYIYYTKVMQGKEFELPV